MLPDAARTVFLWYFVSHIPITMCVDAQAVLPAAWFPSALKDLLAWHVSVNNDMLMGTLPLWFRAVCCCEVALQLPFFFYAVRALVNRDNGARVGMVVYGAHVATTLVPILAVFADAGTAFDSEGQRWALIAIYLPYLLVPLALVYYFGREAEPFGRAKRS